MGGRAWFIRQSTREFKGSQRMLVADTRCTVVLLVAIGSLGQEFFSLSVVFDS